ncbi:MAG: hypothetical protein ABGZ49_16385 [Akkermansiaceae bacterium]
MVCLLAPTLLVAQTKPWPREHKTRPVKLVFGSDATTGNQVVTTRHFRMVSERPIARQDFARFAKVVESVPQLIKSFPLPLWSPPSEKTIEIIFFTEESAFVRAGGSRGAVGWWDGIKRRALIRSDYFLAPPRPGNSKLQPGPDQDLLVHEMVHMSMTGILWRLPPWFFEGTAEYFAICHQGDGWYLFRDLESMIRDHLRVALAVNKVGDNYHLLSVEKVLKVDHQGWLAETQNEFNGNPYLPYATGLLLAHYHFHGGRARRETVATHLSKLHALDRRAKTPAFPHEDGKLIEERLVKFWAPKGLHLVFGE